MCVCVRVCVYVGVYVGAHVCASLCVHVWGLASIWITIYQGFFLSIAVKIIAGTFVPYVIVKCRPRGVYGI